MKLLTVQCTTLFILSDTASSMRNVSGYHNAINHLFLTLIRNYFSIVCERRACKSHFVTTQQ